MEYKIPLTFLAACMLALTSMQSDAGQGGGGGGGGGGGSGAMDRPHQLDQDRTFDRDRTQDRIRLEEPDQDRDKAQDRDQDRDRIHLQDPSNIKDKDIYGGALMNPNEMKQYRQELASRETTQERSKYQYEHEKKMQQRALEQGKDLVPPGQGALYGGELMTVQERNDYREQLRQFDSESDRLQFQAQHRDKIDERAKALNLEVEEAE
jgi:hypothetical protein